MTLLEEVYIFSSKNTKVSTLAETAFGLETSAIHLHGGIFERLWRQNFDNQNRFGLGQLLGVNTNNAHFAHHIWSVMRR